jgi:membrane fusion protein (multidrug efflux system)
MHASPDRLLDPPFKSNGSSLLEAPPVRVKLPAHSHNPHHELPAPPVRLGKLVLGVAILIVVGLIGGWLPRMHKHQVTLEEARALAVPSVRVTAPAPSRSAEPISLSGELRPVTEAPIYARVTGYVRKWYVDLGAHVKEGQLLAELDTPETDRELAEARAQVRQAEAARELAAATARRWGQLLGTRSVSPQETEEKTGDLSVKVAALAAAKANVERLDKMAGFAKLTAPFAGTVTVRRLDVGQLVNAGNGQELFRIAETDRLRVFVRVPQSFSRAVAEGQKAEITLPELADRKFEAHVVRSAGAMDAASRTLLTELEIDNSKGELLAGSYVQVRLAETLPDAALTVSSNALLFRSEGPQIAVVNDKNQIELRKVVLGRDFGAALEILEGIQPKDRVVVNPPDSLVDGVEVRIAQDAPAAGAH